MGFAYKLERVIDDFALLATLMGNKTVPQLPFLNYEDFGLDCLLYLYKRVLPFLEGYITENGDIDTARFAVIFKDLGFLEEIMVKNLQHYKECK